VLIQTEPAENVVLVEGPITVELRGVVQPGTKVTANGHPLTVGSDGTFHALAGPQIRIEAERDGRRKTIVRRFTVRRN